MFRHRNIFFTTQVLAGDRSRHPGNLCRRTLGYHLTAMFPGAGSDVQDLVRRVHGLFVMLHHQQAVAQVPQVLKSLQELGIIPLVQTDAGLIQDVQHPGQAGADLGRQPDTLGFAAA